MNRISIIIVNFNSGDFLLRCLSSISVYVKMDYEVVVVDNSSTDNSIHMCADFFSKPCYILVRLKKNMGFSIANNIGASYSSGNILHFLNPDTELREGILSDYQYVIDNPDNVYVNDLENPNGTFVKSKNLLPTIRNYINRLFYFESCKYWYTGATVIISKGNFIKIGKWNESYFMYAEDMDIFYNIIKNNISVRKLGSIITHVGGGCTSNVWNNENRECLVQKSFKKFYKINGLMWQYPLIVIIMFLYQLFLNPMQAFYFIKICIKILK